MTKEDEKRVREIIEEVLEEKLKNYERECWVLKSGIEN